VADCFLVFLPLAHEILFETSFSTGLGFAFVEHGISRLYRAYQIIDILSHENLEDKRSSFPEKYIGDVEDGEIEFHTTILVDSCLSRSVSSDIRSDAIHFIDL